MPWKNPLRHLPPLSDHPSASPSLSPTFSDRSLTLLECTVRIGRLQESNYKARVLLDTFFKHLTEDGRWNLAADVVNTRDDEQLVQLAGHLLDAILKPFMLAGGQAPRPLSTPPSMDAPGAIDQSMATMEASTRGDQALLRRDCLARDGYRCVFTGYWDSDSCARGVVQPPPGQIWRSVECAHIIPFALGKFDETDAVQTRNKAIIWFALYRYFPEIEGKIEPGNINQHGNALSLSLETHSSFSKYWIGFEPQGPNQYRFVQLMGGNLGIPSKTGTPVVDFESSDASITMPDPAFLQVHLSIGKILQVSGFGKMIRAGMVETSVLNYRGLNPNGDTDVGDILSRLMLMDITVGSSTRPSEIFDEDDN